LATGYGGAVRLAAHPSTVPYFYWKPLRGSWVLELLSRSLDS